MSDTPTILAQAQAKLTESLAQLPEGKRGAIAVVATTDGARVAFANRINDNWQVEAFAEKPWTGKVRAEAEVIFSWK